MVINFEIGQKVYGFDRADSEYSVWEGIITEIRVEGTGRDDSYVDIEATDTDRDAHTFYLHEIYATIEELLAAVKEYLDGDR